MVRCPKRIPSWPVFWEYGTITNVITIQHLFIKHLQDSKHCASSSQNSFTGKKPTSSLVREHRKCSDTGMHTHTKPPAVGSNVREWGSREGPLRGGIWSCNENKLERSTHLSIIVPSHAKFPKPLRYHPAEVEKRVGVENDSGWALKAVPQA